LTRSRWTKPARRRWVWNRAQSTLARLAIGRQEGKIAQENKKEEPDFDEKLLDMSEKEIKAQRLVLVVALPRLALLGPFPAL